MVSRQPGVVATAQRSGSTVTEKASTRYLVTGAGGMLGIDIAAALAGRAVTALTRAELDVSDLAAVRSAVSGHDVVINAAAYTKVDDAETHEADAYAVNALGAQNLAIAAAENDARLVQVSTDYVFNGTANTPYAEDTALDPISVYGRTKANGERLAVAAHPDGTYIVRTAWTYGANGPNFAATMLRLAGVNETVQVVNDQLGQPTWTADLGRQIVALLDARGAAGIYHATNSGVTSWFEFAREIFRQSGLDPERVLATTSDEFLRPAPRPGYSVLGHRAWSTVGVAPMRDWRDALTAAFAAGAFSGDPAWSRRARLPHIDR